MNPFRYIQEGAGIDRTILHENDNYDDDEFRLESMTDASITARSEPVHPH